SDFLTSGYQSALSRLARRHDVIALQLYDPRERELPDLGLVTLHDSESGAWQVVDTSDRAARDQFHRHTADFERELHEDLRFSGADVVRLETGRPYAESLITFFRRRERAQRR